MVWIDQPHRQDADHDCLVEGAHHLGFFLIFGGIDVMEPGCQVRPHPLIGGGDHLLQFGTGITDMPPGSQRGLQVVVPDAEAARRQLVGRGVDASDVDVQPWGSFVTFSDPDGNSWTLQQMPPRG